VDIHASENATWFELYKYDIPVVHIEGEEHARHRLSESDFSKALKDRIAKEPQAS
jgi:hypothetical protein